MRPENTSKRMRLALPSSPPLNRRAIPTKFACSPKLARKLCAITLPRISSWKTNASKPLVSEKPKTPATHPNSSSWSIPRRRPPTRLNIPHRLALSLVSILRVFEGSILSSLGDDVGGAGHLQCRALSLRLLQAGAASLRCGIGYVRLGSQELNLNAQAGRSRGP